MGAGRLILRGDVFEMELHRIKYLFLTLAIVLN